MMADRTRIELFEEAAHKGAQAIIEFFDYHGRSVKERKRLRDRAEIGTKAARIYVADKSAENNARMLDLHARRIEAEGQVPALTSGE